MPRADRKRFVLAHCQTIFSLSCVTEPRQAFLYWFFHNNKKTLDTQMDLVSGPGNDKKSMNFVFFIKNRHKSLSFDNSKITQTEISKLRKIQFNPIQFKFSSIQLRRFQFNQEKNDRFWLFWGIFSEYIKQNIIMAVLRKVNRKTDSNFFFQAAKLLMRF